MKSGSLEKSSIKAVSKPVKAKINTENIAPKQGNENQSDSKDSDKPVKKRKAKSKGPPVSNKEKKQAGFKAKQQAQRLDEIEKFLARVDNPDEWRTLRNADGSEKLVLTDQELSLITRLCQNQMGTADYNPYEPAIHYFSSKVEPMALPAPTEPKRRFIPSLHEAREIKRLVRAIRAGTRKIPGYKAPAKPRFYDIWGMEDDSSVAKLRENHISAPKIKLPKHAESYNLPAEYLFDDKEEAEWRERQAHPDLDEPINPDDYLPQKYSALRLLPGYSRSVHECYARCLDLLLCPRAIKNKININPDSLLPELPDPRDLRPFPIAKSINYNTKSSDPITALSFDSTGCFFASAQGKCINIWSVQDGRSLATWSFDDAVTSVSWNPGFNVPILAATHGSFVSLLTPSSEAFPGSSIARELMSRGRTGDGTPDASWKVINASELRVSLLGPAKQVTWHRKGDYFASIAQPSNSESSASSVVIHHLTRQASQQPFNRLPNVPIHVAFHPLKPAILLVSPVGSVRIYNLQSGVLEKKLQPEASSSALSATLAIHPSGDHVLMAGSDGRVIWFDLDLASRPYQTLTGHSNAVRCVSFHQRLPLFASASSDGSVQICHGQVFQDLMQNPIIVPVKIITGHSNKTNANQRVALTQCTFHPTQPWILTGTVDGSISLLTA
jgi:ribosome biogenesis protein ERB1